MAKKSKVRTRQLAAAALAEDPQPAGKRAAKKLATKKLATKKLSTKKLASKESAARKPGGMKKAEKPATKKTAGAARSKKTAARKKRAAGLLALALPQSRARKLAGDLYQSAGLALWARAIEAAPASEREILVRLQDAICDVADLLKEARSTNPKHLQLYCVASFERDGLPATPRFVTASGADEALEIFKSAHKGEAGWRKARAQLVPVLAAEPQLHD